jgi:hypothetical protein
MRLFVFRCTRGHQGDYWLNDPSDSPPCSQCSSPTRRVFTPPRLRFSNTEARFSPSLGKPVSSDRDFREKLKRFSDKAQTEYEIVDDPYAWAEFSRLEPELIDVKGSSLEYHGGQKTLDVEITDEDPGPQEPERSFREYAEDFIDAIHGS